MGLANVFRNVGHAIGKGVKDTGHAIGDAANNNWVKGGTAALLAATGVGAPASAAMLAGMGATGGALHRGGGLHDAAIGGLKGGASGVASGVASRYLSPLMSKVPGLNRLPGFVGQDVDLSGIDRAKDFVSNIDVGNLGGAPRYRPVSDFLGKAGDFIGDHGDDILKYGKAAGAAYSAYDAKKNRDHARKVLEEEYARRAPLRDAGMAGLLDNSRPDLSSVFNDPNDPSRGRYRKVQIGSRLP